MREDGTGRMEREDGRGGLSGKGEEKRGEERSAVTHR